MWLAYLMTPGFLARSDSIFLTQESHVMPAMESVHERTGSDAVPEEEAVVRGCEFMVNPIEPIRFEVPGCPTLYTGR